MKLLHSWLRDIFAFLKSLQEKTELGAWIDFCCHCWHYWMAQKTAKCRHCEEITQVIDAAICSSKPKEIAVRSLTALNDNDLIQNFRSMQRSLLVMISHITILACNGVSRSIKQASQIFLVISFSIVLFIQSSALAKANNNLSNSTNSQSLENEFSEINSTPLKIVDYPHYSFADIVEPLIPAVVNISTLEYVNSKSDNTDKESLHQKSSLDFINNFLERLNIPFNLDEVESTSKLVPLGSGFIIDPTGLIVTNHHVIANVHKINVKLADNTELPAKLIGSDIKTDLALLKIEFDKALPFVEFGDSNKARVGDWIIAIGNPFGNLGGTVTTGIISSKNRDIDIDTNNIVDNFIQTDASINNGNSGGPMFNLEKEVIGINTAIFSPIGTSIGIGFAIPSNTAKPIIERLKKDGKVNRGRLGVIIQDLTTEIAESLGLQDINGVIVTKVEENSPGDQAGIKSGDVITHFAEQEVKSTKKLRVIVAETPIDEKVKIIVARNGKNIELISKITTDDEPKKEVVAQMDNNSMNDPENKSSITKDNIIFSNLTNDLKIKFNISNDRSGIIIINVSKEEETFKIGDLITMVGQETISSIEDFEKIYENAKNLNKQNILLLVERENDSIFIPLLVK